jgi:hypothetical protein
VLRQRLAIQLVVADYVDCLAFGKKGGLFAFGSFAQDAISELDDRAAEQRRPGLDQNLVVVAGGRAIAATGIDNRQNAIVVDLQLAVGEAERPQQFDAPNLKPDQIVGIVDNALRS